VVGTNWYQATAYCNWLSKEEGIPEDQWCYEIKGNVTTLKAKYLSLSGYRLPTETEMEYAIRAGAVTARYFGETDDLLAKYAWYLRNSQERTSPVGILKPNDLGLFDVHGNVFTWCQESFKAYPAGKGDKAEEDQEDGLVVRSTGGPCVAWWLVRQSCDERAFCLPNQQCADAPSLQFRFSCGEDFTAYPGGGSKMELILYYCTLYDKMTW